MRRFLGRDERRIRPTTPTALDLGVTALFERNEHKIRATTTTKVNSERVHAYRPHGQKGIITKLALCMTEFILEWVFMDQIKADDMFEFFSAELRDTAGFYWPQVLRDYLESNCKKSEVKATGIDIIAKMYNEDGSLILGKCIKPSVLAARKAWTIHLCSFGKLKDDPLLPRDLQRVFSWLSEQPSEAFAEGGTLGWRKVCLNCIIEQYHTTTHYSDVAGRIDMVVRDVLSSKDEDFVQVQLNGDLLFPVERAALWIGL